MTRRAVAALGIGQCVNWGVLYYAFAVFVLPLERELGVASWAVTGAYSMALLMSAVFAPAVGRLGDRGLGPRVMDAGGFAAAGLLAVWAIVPGLFAHYAIWAALGACMAATLYEPAFVIVGRAHEDPAARLRRLAAITLFGGLASTVFLPLAAVLVAAAGWRGAALTLAAVLAASTWATHVLAFRELPRAGGREVARDGTPREGFVPRPDAVPDPLQFAFAAAAFALVSFAAAAFTANLVPALGERGLSPATAGVLGGGIGLMQLPGRALLLRGSPAGGSPRLLAVSLLLQSAGFAGIALASSAPPLAAGTMVFALGAGLTTLLRPQIIQEVFGAASAGALNGRIARAQQLARAAGPIAVAWIAGKTGFGGVFFVVACAFALAAIASRIILRAPRPDPESDPAAGIT